MSGKLLQALCDAATAAALSSAGSPSDTQEREICALMERVSAADLGLVGGPTKRKHTDGPPVIYTQSVLECRALDIVVFIFPAGASIPLHDHPGMTVFSKILYGELGMSSFDWVQPPTTQELAGWASVDEQPRNDTAAAVGNQQRSARRRGDTILNCEAPTFVLRPEFANIHAFAAASECAVLDVLMPPYDDERGRDCHYFEEVEARPAPPADLSLLRVIAAPPNLIIRRSQYQGPAVHAKSGVLDVLPPRPVSLAAEG